MGERAKSIGEEAEDKIWNLIDSLGYEIQETNNEVYDIDCIAESPPEKPAFRLGKPCFSPKGLVAFEVRESSITQKKVANFRKKILKYNRESNNKLKGGIYIIDRRISKSMIEFMIRRQIWGWGVRRQRLYREKAIAFNYWFKGKKAFTTEIMVDNRTSYLRIATPMPRKFKQLLHFLVFYDDIYQKLTPKIVKQTMNRIKKTSISPLMDLGMKPMNVFFQFFSIGGKSDYLRESLYNSVIEPWSDEGITVIMGSKPFIDFRAFTLL